MVIVHTKKNRPYTIQKRVYRDVHFYGGWKMNQDYGWTDWEDYKGFHYLEICESTIMFLNRNKHRLKQEIQFRIVRNWNINEATLEIQELIGIKK